VTVTVDGAATTRPATQVGGISVTGAAGSDAPKELVKTLG
jgi:hypothetical protein